ncbi:MAG: type VI secretion system membrane subunit TssM [Alphaproteobacteria bacterium]
MLSLLGRVIKSGWFWSFVGVLLLCLMIWFALGAIGFGGVYPFEDPLYRLAAILVVVIIYFLFVFISMLRSQRANRKMVGELDVAGAAAVSSEEQEMTAQEVATLRERMREAMGLLRKAKFGRGFGRRYLYQLPWYILVGPPGSGKTTALVKSGLRFVLADKLGGEAVRGVGGTRNCDWWFTDEAVLIDTAGRYTTQDTRSAVDTGGWHGFLDLLRRNRPRQPINGVFIVIAINEVMAMDDAARAEHARIIRTRINELHERLRQRFPIYVLLTKCDLVAGFIEFFDELGGEERQQVWGMTFPLDGDRNVEGTAAGFSREFDLLVDRLNQRLVDRMHREVDIERRSLVYGFPAQMGSLRDLLQEFLDAVFRPSQFEERPMLRGVYFTSGTQEGTPIDRLMGALAARFGVSRSTMPAFSGGGRSYFLTRLLREVAFPEAYIAVARSPRERRRIWVRRTGYAVVGLVAAAALAAFGLSFVGNQQLIAETEQQIDAYGAALASVPTSMVDDTDFARTSGLLDRLRALPAGYDVDVDSPPLDLTFGLYQGDKLHDQAVGAYLRGLNKMLAPRLFLHLEDKLRSNLGAQDRLYNYLRVYLMLGNTGDSDPALIRSVMADDWGALYPGDDNAGLRSRLAAHLDVLLANPDYDFPLDTGLVQQARQALVSIPLEGEAYEAIKGSDPARNLPTWRVIDHIGAQGDRVMVRRSEGTPLTAGVPGLYTYRGFNEVFLPALDAISSRVASQNWVLSGDASDADRAAALETFRQGVTQSYLNDYVEEWDRLLNDVTIRPMETLDEARTVLNILSSPNSPLLTFLTDAAQETTLARPQPAAPASAPGDAAPAAADGAAPPAPAGDDGGLLGPGTAPAPAGPLPGQYVNDQFADLHAMVGGADGQPPALTGLLADFRDLYRGLNALQTSDGTIPPDFAAALQKVNEVSATLPEPIAGVVAEVMAASATVGAGGARSQLRQSYDTTVLQTCEQALAGRYPFDPLSREDISLVAFAQVLGPGGLLDSFFQQNLAAHVDMTKKPWTWKPASVSLNLSNAALQQFERADEIRKVFFAAGPTPSIQFVATPDVMSETINRAVLTVDGQVLRYSFGPNAPVAMVWPGPDGPPGVMLELTPPMTGQPNGVSYQGPWGWFRMLDVADVQPGSTSDKLNVTIAAGERSLTVEVRAEGVTNPFVMTELKEFRCPTTL